MGKVTIALGLLSTVVLLITFGQGVSVLRGADVAAHFPWAMGTLVTVLTANVFAMIHAAQSDRIIRALRRDLAAAQEKG